MRVPLLDLKAQTASLRAAIDAAIARVVTSGHFILGPEVEGLEVELAALCGTRCAVGVSSGTDALLMSLWALGVGPGDEVVTTPYSFFATVGSIARLGARPVLCDVERGTLNLDCARAAALCTARTKAFVPVHLYGRMARLEVLRAACPRVPIIEDAAQAVGAERQGVRAGAVGLAGCLSFFPSKNLGAFGDGGMVLTSDQSFATRLRSLRAHGSTPGRKYHHEIVGGNFRLDALQAAILRAKLPHLESFSAARARNAARYRALLGGVPIELPPAEEPGERCVYNQFVIRAEKRDVLQDYLKQHGIGTEVYYPVPLHLQPCFAGLGYGPGAFPEAEDAARTSLALPIYPELEAPQLEYVAEQIRAFYGA
ncbi:MAG: DegT/DnrJ/EryC1/StrS family aminotransferase [Deltaproteobacteria bacterium]|nr:DegT/DnrJ/EryC1/StrS family aminotransferase [Deltaproteobacteria bacterium]